MEITNKEHMQKRSRRRTLKRVAVAISAVLIGWAFIFIVDYMIAIEGNRFPLFCIKGELYEPEEGGTIRENKCLGYKIYVVDIPGCDKNQLKPMNFDWKNYTMQCE